MKLIVGLGNPGPEYARTRHNAGFLAIDRIAARCNIHGDKAKFHGLALDGRIAGEKCLLLKPMTYMNKSGLCVGEALTFYKLDPAADLLVLVDDIALPTGSIRLRASGGAGGHNGLKDIQRIVGNNNYPRLRIGIDPPGRVPQIDYVLGRFSEDQMTELLPALDKSCDAVECWLNEGLDKAMSLYNA